MSKPLASLSLDLDDLWTYLKTHGNNRWQEYPSYLDIAIPRILDFLDHWDTKITFFIVAQDAAFPKNHELLQEIVKRGHDIGNHTFHHDPWLHTYSEQQIHDELQLAEKSIFEVTNKHPRGFRGPGFSFSKTVLKVLIDRGYEYDATTFPNILNPLARMYFLKTSKLDKDEIEKRKGLFGSWKDGLRPNKSFQWSLDGQKTIEIPVTTIPLLKIPFHASYILYLSSYNRYLASVYFRFALTMCRITNTPPSVLLHPLDFLGSDDTSELSFFPAMKIKSAKKIGVMNDVFRILTSRYRVVTMEEHKDYLVNQKKLNLKPVF